MFITKSDYLRYLQCPKYFWLYKHKKDLLPKTTEVDQAVFDQGYEVEDWARKLFPEGVEVKENFQKGKEETQNHIKNGKTTIFQATAMPENLLVRADIIQYNPTTNEWDIYEVKSSTQIKKEHLPDLAFQKVAFTKDGFKIGKTYLIHVDNTYVRDGDVDPKKLLQIENISEQVDNLTGIVEIDIPKALELLELTEPEITIGSRCKKPYGCGFKDYCWSGLPDFSIYELGRTNDKKLQALTAMGVETITEIPEDFPLSKAQQNQVLVTKTNNPIIDSETINDFLSTLQYPLYFLDYETYGSAVPIFNGTKAYQSVCFQYSLHVIRSQDSEVEHYEYLHRDGDNPSEKLLLTMRQHIGDEGSIIVWNKGFEMSRNDEMAEQYSEYADFLHNVNSRVFDLMEIFSKQHYVHADFKGSYSIKKVLPILAPHLSYKNLEDIQEGATASLYWFKYIHQNTPEKEKMIKNLLEYCKLDTWAMVEIYNRLKDLPKTRQITHM